MKLAFVSVALLFFCQCLCSQTVRLHVQIIEEDTRRVTPAMVCVTNLHSRATYMPPGMPTPQPSFPDVFYTGVAFSDGPRFAGPVRKMMGAGSVNGQRTYVYGQSPSLPYWKDSISYQTNGHFFLDLAPGTYRISIEHGNEYLPVQRTVTLRPHAHRVDARLVLKRWIDLPARGWYSGDVHTHHPLNKPQFRDYMLNFARAEDVHLVNVSQMGDRQQVYFRPNKYGKQSRVWEGNICLVTGQEDPRHEFGHVIGLNIDTLIRDTSHYAYYDPVFNGLHKNPNSLAGFAHFAYSGEGVREGLAIYAPTGAIDFVELMQNTKINTADYYDYLNLGFRISAAYGSDFPWGSTIGDGRVFVYTGAAFSPDRWFEGLKGGHSFVSNGPALFLEADDAIPGDELKRSTGDSVQIRLTALCHPSIGLIDSLELVGSDGVLACVANPGNLDSLSLTLRHRLLHSQWVAARVVCTNGALAHTSPIYLVADGLPVYNREKGPAIVRRLIDTLSDARNREAAKSYPDSGIIDRINNAVERYENLSLRAGKSVIPGR